MGRESNGRVEEPLNDARLLALYRDMVRLRTYDERSVLYHRQGRIGTYALYWGHEAMQAGAVHALEASDWIFPSYRESAIGLLRGMPASTVLSWWRGHPEGWWNPLDWRIASVAVPVGSHLPHAAGLAWGLRLRGETACALAFFGDGATSEGAFHEGVTFAAATNAPVVFLCNNNGWAISTPASSQVPVTRLADKAAGYGIHGVTVDGGDVLAVHAAVRSAAERARAGGGPSLVEAVTYRMGPHATADDPRLYIDADRVRAEREREGVLRFAATLRQAGVLDDATDERLRAAAVREIEDGIDAAEALDPPDPSLVFSTTFAEPPPSLRGAGPAAPGLPRWPR